MILDNSITAMTGMQDTIVSSSRIIEIIKGVGVNPDHIKILKPLKKYLEENIEIIKEEIEYNGVSVIIQVRECIHIIGKNKKK